MLFHSRHHNSPVYAGTILFSVFIWPLIYLADCYEQAYLEKLWKINYEWQESTPILAHSYDHIYS